MRGSSVPADAGAGPRPPSFRPERPLPRARGPAAPEAHVAGLAATVEHARADVRVDARVVYDPVSVRNGMLRLVDRTAALLVLGIEIGHFHMGHPPQIPLHKPIHFRTGIPQLGVSLAGLGIADACQQFCLEDVMVLQLNPGSYTVQVTGVGAATGTALVEIYDADQP